MSDLELPFRLPVSCVRIAGTRAFVHDAVLEQGAVPLDVLEQPATAEIASTSAPERDEGLMTAPPATR